VDIQQSQKMSRFIARNTHNNGERQKSRLVVPLESSMSHQLFTKPFSIYVKIGGYSNYSFQNLDNIHFSFGKNRKIGEWGNWRDLKIVCHAHSDMEDELYREFYFNPIDDVPDCEFVELQLLNATGDDSTVMSCVQKFIAEKNEELVGKSLSFWIACSYEVECKELPVEILMTNRQLENEKLSMVGLYCESRVFEDVFGRCALVLPICDGLFFDVYLAKEEQEEWSLINRSTDWCAVEFTNQSDKKWLMVAPQLEQGHSYKIKVVVIEKTYTWLQYPLVDSSGNVRIFHTEIPSSSQVQPLNQDILNSHHLILNTVTTWQEISAQLTIPSNPIFHLDCLANPKQNIDTGVMKLVIERSVRNQDNWQVIQPIVNLDDQEVLKSVQIDPQLNYQVRCYYACYTDRHHILKSKPSASKLVPSSLSLSKEMGTCGEMSKTYDTTLRIMTRSPIFFIYLTGFSSRIPNFIFYNYRVEARLKNSQSPWINLGLELATPHLKLKSVPLTYNCKVFPYHQLLEYGKTYTVRIICSDPISRKEVVVKEFTKIIPTFSYAINTTEILERNGGMMVFETCKRPSLLLDDSVMSDDEDGYHKRSPFGDDNEIVNMYLFLNGDVLMECSESEIYQGTFTMSNVTQLRHKIIESTNPEICSKIHILNLDATFALVPKNSPPNAKKVVTTLNFEMFYNCEHKRYDLVTKSFNLIKPDRSLSLVGSFSLENHISINRGAFADVTFII